jgi:hypothetical protein
LDVILVKLTQRKQPEAFMKRSNSKSPNFIFPHDLLMRASFHEAGHAVAIYLYNREKGLPPVHFSIKFSGFDELQANRGVSRVEGGRLIQVLPAQSGKFLEYLCRSDAKTKNAFLAAFEADVVNYLCGPIAEAKYTAHSDGEEIDGRLLNPAALLHYGGASDLKIVDSYMHSRFEHKTDKTAKIAELFRQAFDFVNNAAIWRAINALAQHLRETPKHTIDCEEAIAVIDRCLALQPPLLGSA